MKVFGIIIWSGLVAVWTWTITFIVMEVSWKKDAVRHGCAEYYLDKNYDRQWRWVAPAK